MKKLNLYIPHIFLIIVPPAFLKLTVMDKSHVSRNTTSDICGKAPPAMRTKMTTKTTKTTTRTTKTLSKMTTTTTTTTKTTTTKLVRKGCTKWVRDPKNMDDYDLSPFRQCWGCNRRLTPCIIHVHEDEGGDYTCDKCGEDVQPVYCCFNIACRKKFVHVDPEDDTN